MLNLIQALVGLAFVVCGAWQVSPPGALILAGLLIWRDATTAPPPPPDRLP